MLSLPSKLVLEYLVVNLSEPPYDLFPYYKLLRIDLGNALKVCEVALTIGRPIVGTARWFRILREERGGQNTWGKRQHHRDPEQSDDY
jgi:hypothetical protein